MVGVAVGVIAGAVLTVAVTPTRGLLHETIPLNCIFGLDDADPLTVVVYPQTPPDGVPSTP